jgi:hypothetical protein
MGTKRRTAPRAIGLLMLVVLVAGVACDSSGTEQAPTNITPPGALLEGDYDVQIDPADFVPVIDNPLFPLKPGTVFRLRGVTKDGVERETIKVTSRTKEVLGVSTTVVIDEVLMDGELHELTEDWYAQDRAGNVWYFGEATAEYEGGKIVSTDGSWKAGVDGAQPGIIMSADPQISDSFRQEYYPGEAEDMFWVVEMGGSHTVPFGSFRDVVQVLEWTPLEPNVVVQKIYAPGTGLIAERALSGGTEVVELLSVTYP